MPSHWFTHDLPQLEQPQLQETCLKQPPKSNADIKQTKNRFFINLHCLKKRDPLSIIYSE